MPMKKQKSKALLFPIVSIWIASILLLAIFISSKNESHKKELEYIEKIYIENLKDKIRIRIDNLATLLSTSYTNKYEAIEFIDNLKYNDGGYIFVLDINKTMLVHKNKMLTNVPFEMMTDERYKENVSNIVSSSMEKTSLFINYKQSKSVFNRKQELNKISYVHYMPTYNFILGTGLYDNDIEKDLKIIRNDLLEKLSLEIKEISLYSFLIAFGISALFILSSIYLKRK